MNGSLLTVISPDISITSYDMQSACVCARVYTARRLFLSPASGCWWPQIAFPLACPTQWRERQSAGVTGASQETDQESGGFCSILDHVTQEQNAHFSEWPRFRSPVPL